MTENMKHWDSLSKTDPAHTKGFKRAGGFSGTAMKPIWIVKRLTEEFGPVGVGWGIGRPEFQVVPVPDAGKVLVYCTVECWHTDPAHTFYGVGGDSVQDEFRNGNKFADDEAFKKAFTDAVNNAFKFVGVGADIHMGQFDDSKYVADLQDEFRSNDILDKLRPVETLIGKCTSPEQLKATWTEHKEALSLAKAEAPAHYKRMLQLLAARNEELEAHDEAEAQSKVKDNQKEES